MSFKNFYDYTIYDDGRIYSIKTNKFLKSDCFGSYAKVIPSINEKPVRYSVHRLIAYSFCNPSENYQESDVDHLDNNHFNNAAYNLERVKYTENNRRTREKGINNVTKNNFERWNNDNFRHKTSQNISKGQIKSGCFSGKNNPRYRFEIRDINGKDYMMSESVKLIGKSSTWVYKHILKFLDGEIIKEFEECGIVSITDLKSKVNRLSKAEKQVE